MPKHKKVLTLYEQSLKSCSNLIYRCAENLNAAYLPNRSLIINQMNHLITTSFSRNILEDLLEQYNRDNVNTTLVPYYYIMLLLRNDIRRFTIKHYRLPPTYWESLFIPYLSNLVELNLALSCTDYILQFIPTCCPKLEILNATCRYERMLIGSNATVFSLSVTDIGLEHLCSCQKLRILILNEPRSQRRGIQNSISYNGLRKLLKNVKTLENITYSDIGNVISKDMENVDTLNLRVIRHYNATETSMKEILRLCKKLEDLYLTFFGYMKRDDVINQIIATKPNLNSLQIINANCINRLDELLLAVGNNLTYLYFSENHERITFSNLVTIGKFCKNLKYFTCFYYNDKTSYIGRTPNFGQFSKLINFELICTEIDFRNVVLFCLKNAEHTLRNLIISNHRKETIKFVENLFLNELNFTKIKEMVLSSDLRFTIGGIEKLVEKYSTLKYLAVYSADDCTEFIAKMKFNNYDFVYVKRLNQMFDNNPMVEE